MPTQEFIEQREGAKFLWKCNSKLLQNNEEKKIIGGEGHPKVKIRFESTKPGDSFPLQKEARKEAN